MFSISETVCNLAESFINSFSAWNNSKHNCCIVSYIRVWYFLLLSSLRAWNTYLYFENYYFHSIWYNNRNVLGVEKTDDLEYFSMLAYWLDMRNSICILSMLPISFWYEIFCGKLSLIWEDIKNFENDWFVLISSRILRAISIVILSQSLPKFFTGQDKY